MEETWKPTTAGILTMIAGIVGIVSGAVITGLAATATLGTFWWFGMPDWGGMMGIGWGISRIVLGIVALIGGMHARRRESWGFALTGTILAVPLVPPLGVLAIIFVCLGKREFK